MNFSTNTIRWKKIGQIRNEDLRKELETEPNVDKNEQRQLIWFGHQIRMNNNFVVKKVLESRIQHRTSRYRSARTWSET